MHQVRDAAAHTGLHLLKHCQDVGFCATGNNFVENICQVSLGNAFFLKLTSDYPRNPGYVLIEPVKAWFEHAEQKVGWKRGLDLRNPITCGRKPDFFHPAKWGQLF